MRRGALLVAALIGPALCCKTPPRYPACDADGQCSVGGRHDYCVGGRCVYCRTAVDCADRQMCQAGRCLSDPHARPLPGADAGADASQDATPDAEEPADDDDDPPADGVILRE